MTKTSRELVRQTLEFDSPARVPRQLWVLPWATSRYADQVAAIQRRYPDDIVSSPVPLKTPLPVKGDRHARGKYVDEWGCTFENVQDGIIGEVKQPLLTDWSRLELVRLPEERLTLDIGEVNDFCRDTDKFVIAGRFPRMFERLQFLRGTAALMIDLMRQPAELALLMRRMHKFYLKELELWAETDVDALMIMDDWGSQRAMLVAPKLWREMFRPLYVEYIDLAHRRGKYAFMHSDGYILDILPDLADLGLDALNAQIACMGVAQVGAACAGKLTFWGEMDRQQLLPYGTRDEVFAAVRDMRCELWRGGGAIAQCEFGPGARPENIEAVFEAWDGP